MWADRIKMIAGAYIIPLICSVWFAHIGMTYKGGEEVEIYFKMLSGFIFGMMIEGLAMVVVFTLAVIAGRLD